MATSCPKIMYAVNILLLINSLYSNDIVDEIYRNSLSLKLNLDIAKIYRKNKKNTMDDEQTTST